MALHAYGLEGHARSSPTLAQTRRIKTSTPTAWMTATGETPDPKTEDKHAYGVDDGDRGDPGPKDRHAYGVDDGDRGDPGPKDRHAYGVDDVEGFGLDLTLETRSWSGPFMQSTTGSFPASAEVYLHC